MIKSFNIEINNTHVTINGKRHYFMDDMDKANKEDDMNKKVLVALACEMGYEPVFLFEEMADRLDEMLDEEE